jgi:hypothetical protein
MGRLQRTISLITFAIMILGLTIVASAQYRDRGRNNSGYYGNQDISSSIKILRDQARQFEDTLDRELDRSRHDGSRREDNLNKLAGKFKNAAEDLDDEYKGRRNERKSADEARKVLNLASQLDQDLSASRIGRDSFAVRQAWTGIERNLVTISRAYNYTYNGRYGRNGGGGYGNNDGPYGNNRGNGPYGNNRDNGPYGNNRDNGPYGNNRYGNLGGTISNLKAKARVFENTLDSDRNNRNNRTLENLSDRFKNAVDDLADEYYDRDNGFQEAQRVLSIAEQLDAEVARTGVNRSIRRDWNSIENDLNVLARGYNINYRRNNGGGIRDIFRNFPF